MTIGINSPSSPSSTSSTPMSISRSPSPLVSNETNSNNFNSLVLNMENVKEELKNTRKLLSQKDGKIFFLISQIEKKKLENETLTEKNKMLEVQIIEKDNENNKIKNLLKLKEGKNLLLNYQNIKLFEENKNYKKLLEKNFSNISIEDNIFLHLIFYDFIKHYKNNFNIKGELINKIYAKKSLENITEEEEKYFSNLLKQYNEEKNNILFSSTPSESQLVSGSDVISSTLTGSVTASSTTTTSNYLFQREKDQMVSTLFSSLTNETNQFDSSLPLHGTRNFNQKKVEIIETRNDIPSSSTSDIMYNSNNSLNNSLNNSKIELPSNVLSKIFSSPSSVSQNVSSPPSSGGSSGGSSASTINNFTNIVTPSTIDTIDRSLQQGFQTNNFSLNLFEDYRDDDEIIHAHSTNLSEDSTLDAHDLSCHTLNTTLEQFPTQIISPTSTISTKKDISSSLALSPADSVKIKQSEEILSPYSAYLKNKSSKLYQSSPNSIHKTPQSVTSKSVGSATSTTSDYFQDHLSQIRSENNKLRNEINEFKSRLESLKKDCLNIRNSSLNLEKKSIGLLPTTHNTTQSSSIYHSTSSLYSNNFKPLHTYNPSSSSYTTTPSATTGIGSATSTGTSPANTFVPLPLPPLPSFSLNYYTPYSSTLPSSSTYLTATPSTKNYTTSTTSKSYTNIYDRKILI